MERSGKKPIEGDLIETGAKWIFDVKGLVHPLDKVIAFPRFIPDPNGDRKRRGQKYRKVYELSERFKLLEKSFPQYLENDQVFDERLCEVPSKDLLCLYSPIDRLREIRDSQESDDLERCALAFFQHVSERVNTSWPYMGISGSLLVKLHTSKSDIDPIVYGSDNCSKVHGFLKEMLKDGDDHFKPYNCQELRILYDFRSKDTMESFEDFVRTESRKVMQGRFMQRDYFMRFVKNRSEINEEYGDVQYSNSGYARLKATVADDSESIFTPCSYKIDDVRVLEGPEIPVEEVVSFRGRFCEQARKGEAIIAQGKIEKVQERRKSKGSYRLLLGNRPSDYLILL